MFVCNCHLSLEVGRKKTNTIIKTRMVVSLVNRPTMLALVGKIKSSYDRQVALSFRPEFVPGFSSMKRLRSIFTSPPPGWVASPPQDYFSPALILRYLIFLLLSGERHCESLVSCPNIQVPARHCSINATELPMRWTGGKSFCVALTWLKRTTSAHLCTRTSLGSISERSRAFLPFSKKKDFFFLQFLPR